MVFCLNCVRWVYCLVGMMRLRMERGVGQADDDLQREVRGSQLCRLTLCQRRLLCRVAALPR
jgi:hypothetical protein